MTILSTLGNFITAVVTPTTTRSMSVEPSDSTSFATLPEEVVVKILEQCDSKTVLACQLTCRTLRDVVTNSTSLRYKLALFEHGMCDGPSSELCTAEKLDLLNAHATALQSLDSALPEKAESLLGWGPPMATSGNIVVFFKKIEEAGRQPRLDLLVLRVPSALRRVEAAQWTLALPAGVEYVCIDATQDLLIYLLDSTFHACTLSTGAVHPLVAHGGLFNTWNGNRRFDVSCPCVYGDFVAAPTRGSLLSVWNWKTGQLISDQHTMSVLMPFEFLDDHHIIFTSSEGDGDCVYVYNFRHGVVNKQQNSQEQIRNARMGRVRFQLALPPHNSRRSARFIYFCLNRLSRGALQPSGVRVTGSASPFYADPRERLIAIRVTTIFIVSEAREDQFDIHVPARAFLHHFASAVRDGGQGGREVVLPWPAWRDIVCTTPLRSVGLTKPPLMAVYGMRAVCDPPNWDEGVLHVDSYLPRKRSREAGEGKKAMVAESGGGTRQGLRLPGGVEGDFISVFCEDALLLYKPDQYRTTILDAYWYHF
ncbi:hypothetical protein BC826DRAFT_353329 [Russula brevipes]|nr:hypothetical protein BC826DRAFT_353329 [Russula brevipes]